MTQQQNAADRLLAAVDRVKNPTVLGLDTQVGHLPAEFAPRDSTPWEICRSIVAYNRALLTTLRDVVGVVKVQAAYYERYGVTGMKAFSDTLAAASSMGYVTMADAKRGDIGATAGAYADAFLADGDFSCDFVTVNAYLGIDGVEPFVKAAAQNGRGLFVLVKTSNPSGAQLQDLTTSDGRKIYEVMADLVAGWGKELVGTRGYSSVGAVVGATWPEELSSLRARLPGVPFLVPGYGAQGGTGADLRDAFDTAGLGAVVNASRSLLAAHQKESARGLPWMQAVKNEALRMREDIMGGLPQ